MYRNSKKTKLSMVIKSPLKLKLVSQTEKLSIKQLYNKKLEQLFSHPPSSFGYKSDIESIMNELALTKDQLFRMVINSLSRTSRTNPEIRIIASYLFLMQDFLKLLKAKNPEQKENVLLKDLLTLAENVDYEKSSKDTVLMRCGEKGNNAFIILNGKVDVLIESYFYQNLGDKTYLYYLANLIKYQEYGLVNNIINENFKKYPIELIDDITVKNNGLTIIKTKSNNKDESTINSINTINTINTANSNTNTNSNKKEEQINHKTIDIPNKNNIGLQLKKNLRHSVPLNPKTLDIRFSFKKEIRKRFKRTNTFKGKSGDDIGKFRKRQTGLFKLNYINEEFKGTSTIPIYTATELLRMFGLKLADKKYNKEFNHVNTEDYIKRLNILNFIKSDEIEIKLKKEKTPKEPIKPDKSPSRKTFRDKSNQSKKEISKDNSKSKNEEKEKNDDSKENSGSYSEENSDTIKSSFSSESSEDIYLKNELILENMKLGTYSKIVSLDRGALFGEMALNDPNALRKATIITNGDCHFAVLNKKIFNNSIKIGAQRHMKDTLQFFIEIPIFNGIPESVFYNKYYTNLSKSTIVKGKNVINQGEKPDHVTLLQTGSYGLTTRMSLYDLTRLILHYADVLIYQSINNHEINRNNKNASNKNQKDISIKKDNMKKEKTRKEENKKELDKLNNIQKLLSQESALLADSIVFKKYYNSIQHIRITEIYSPEVILNDEFIDENGLYAFTIEAKAPENIIYTLNNKFLVDIKEKNILIQKNKEKFVKQKMDFMIKRLLIIRNSMINSFFDSKAKKDIGEAVIKELEEMILLNLKKKRVLNKKEEIILNPNENEKKENIIKNNLLLRNGTELNKEKIITNKSKPLKSHENTKFEYEFKSKAFKKNNLDQKKVLKPLSVSLRTAIKYTNHDNKVNKKQKEKSRNRRNTINNIINKNKEGLLFSLDEIEKNNYINKNFMKTNTNLSRNNGIKINYKPFSLTYRTNNTEFNNNNQLMHLKTRKVIMNNLIWENIKSGVKFPIKLNYLETNNYKNNENDINNNLNLISGNNTHTYYDHFYKSHLPNLKNNYLVNFKNYKNTSFSYDNYYHDMQIEYQNNLCYLSPQNKLNPKNNINNNKSLSIKKDNSYSKNDQKTINTVQNLKKNEVLLKMKLKKLIKPDEIQMMRMRKLNYFVDRNKYNKVKEEKFETNRNHYYKKTIMKRINFFYGKNDK